jgi:hypothetical protein
MLLGGAIWIGLLAGLVLWSYGRFRYLDFCERRDTAKRIAFAQHDPYSAWARLWP